MSIGGRTGELSSYKRQPERNLEARQILMQRCDGEAACDLIIDNETLRPAWLQEWNSIDSYKKNGHQCNAHSGSSNIQISYACGDGDSKVAEFAYLDRAYLTCTDTPD